MYCFAAGFINISPLRAAIKIAQVVRHVAFVSWGAATDDSSADDDDTFEDASETV